MNWKILKSKRIYLDYNATTVPDKEAFRAFKQAFSRWGNPSSIHQCSSEVKYLLWEARKQAAQFLNCHPLELIFTSGASESNNQAIKGLFLSPQQKRNELIVSSVEHASVLSVSDFLEKKGFKVHRIPVSRKGVLDEECLQAVLSEKTCLVSIMKAHNETGVLFPIEKWIERAHEKGALFHSDMVQCLGKEKVNLKNLSLDLASFSAHKMYGLKGCGLLYCKKGVELESLIHGGPQERKRRAGTENVLGAVAFGAVMKKGDFFIKENEKLKKLRDYLEENLSGFFDVEFVGQGVNRLPNTSCFQIAGIEGETLLMNLDLEGFSVSVGSACHSGKVSASPALLAMGLSEEEAKNCIRVSLGYGLKKRDIDFFMKCLRKLVKRLNQLKH